MTIVLDTSAAMEIVFKRSQSGLLRESVSNSDKVITSDLYKAEAANTIWKYVNGNFLDKQSAYSLLHLTLALIDEYHDIDDYCLEALNEAQRCSHPVYDMLYLTLARRNGAALLTKDKILNQLASESGIETIPELS